MSTHTVTAGTLGTVYEGQDEAQAQIQYNGYVLRSKARNGAPAGQPIAWSIDGKTHRAHPGRPEAAPVPQVDPFAGMFTAADGLSFD